MKFTSDVTILSARRYQMADDKTGELIQGTKIAYVEDWDGQTEQNKRRRSGAFCKFSLRDFRDPRCTSGCVQRYVYDAGRCARPRGAQAFQS